MAFGGSQSTTQADLAPAFEYADKHDVADPDRPDEQRHRAQSKEETVERAFGFGPGLEGERGLANVDLVGVFGVGGCAEHGVDGVDLVSLRPHIDLGGMAVEAQIALGSGKPDQDGADQSRGPARRD